MINIKPTILQAVIAQLGEKRRKPSAKKVSLHGTSLKKYLGPVLVPRIRFFICNSIEFHKTKESIKDFAGCVEKIPHELTHALTVETSEQESSIIAQRIQSHVISFFYSRCFAFSKNYTKSA